VTSHFNQPELQMFFREHAQSVAGSIRVKKHWGKGELVHVVDEVKQVFQLVPGVKSFETQEDARFKYFKDCVLAPLLRLEQKHTLIVTPSYFSYVRVRNELMKQDVSFSVAFFAANIGFHISYSSCCIICVSRYFRQMRRMCVSTVETVRSQEVARVSSTARTICFCTPADATSSGTLVLVLVLL